jgi:hypothetical protein
MVLSMHTWFSLIPAVLSLVGSVYILVVSTLLLPARGGKGGGTLSPVRWLAVADIIFVLVVSSFLIKPTRIDPDGHWWCALDNFLFQFSAAATWLWTSVIAFVSVSSLLRSRRGRLFVARYQHCCWLIAALSAVPEIQSSSVDPSGRYCVDGRDSGHLVRLVLCLACFIFSATVLVWGGVQAQKFSPHVVLRRFWQRVLAYLGIFTLCWASTIPWEIHYLVWEKDPKNSSTLFAATSVLQAMQGMLNALVYGYFNHNINQRWGRAKDGASRCACLCPQQLGHSPGGSRSRTFRHAGSSMSVAFTVQQDSPGAFRGGGGSQPQQQHSILAVGGAGARGFSDEESDEESEDGDVASNDSDSMLINTASSFAGSLASSWFDRSMTRCLDQDVDLVSGHMLYDAYATNPFYKAPPVCLSPKRESQSQSEPPAAGRGSPAHALSLSTIALQLRDPSLASEPEPQQPPQPQQPQPQSQQQQQPQQQQQRRRQSPSPPNAGDQNAVGSGAGTGTGGSDMGISHSEHLERKRLRRLERQMQRHYFDSTSTSTSRSFDKKEKEELVTG